MGLLDIARRKASGEPSNEEENAAMSQVANTAIYTRNQGSAQEAENRQDKGIDFDMIHATEAVEELTELAHYTETVIEDVPEVDANQNIIYEKVPAIDKAGNVVYTEVAQPTESGVMLTLKQVVMIERPKLVKVSSKVERTRLWATAALVYIDTVMPTIWMGTYEADTAKLYVRTAFHDIRKEMNKDNSLSFAQKQNCVLLLRAIRDLCLFRLEDTKEGRKALLLKIRHEALDVKMTRGPIQTNKK